jgi:hypothetical protein
MGWRVPARGERPIVPELNSAVRRAPRRHMKPVAFECGRVTTFAAVVACGEGRPLWSTKQAIDAAWRTAAMGRLLAVAMTALRV